MTRKQNERVRYGVVGLGWFAQIAILPAFEHAQENSELVALFSGDPEKLRELGDRHRVARRHSYEEFDDVLRSGEIDAVYIALPNHLHREFAVRASEAGVHVLCEKPMALNIAECREMIRAAEANETKLMIAYRLHFHDGNMRLVERLESGQIGEPRIFNSTFTNKVVNRNDIRLSPTEKGGGPVYDIGVYCANAARYVFRDEPTQVFAYASRRQDDERFAETDESVAVLLRFPDERLASFVCSFGAADIDSYTVAGTEGVLRLEPAYQFRAEHRIHSAEGGGPEEEIFPESDQVAPEILHFSSCILEDREPEPSGWEGLADIRIVDAILQSIHGGRPIGLAEFGRDQRPDMGQSVRIQPVGKQELVRTKGPS